MLKHYGEVYSFLKPAYRNISGLPKFKYLLFSNLYHTSWVTKRKVVIMMKEENVEDKVTRHQLRGLEKTSHIMSISVESKAYGKRRYYQSSSESLSHSFLESSLESLSRCLSPQKKKHGSGSK